MKNRTAKTSEGAKYTLANCEEAGLVTCPGEAHENMHIDNCGLCAPRWGMMMSYKPTTLSAVVKGVAVPVNETGKVESANALSFAAAEEKGTVKMVMLTEKKKGSMTSFFAWVLS